MAYTVKIDSFEGPFDLLLYLVSRKKVDIGAISICEITDQYLAEISRMEKLDLNIASDFLLVAATLLELKAQALMPKPAEPTLEDIANLEFHDAKELLVDKLVEYKKFKNASEELYGRFLAEGRVHARPFGPDAIFLAKMPDFLKGVTLDDLGMIAATALARREQFLLESEHIAAKPIPVETFVRSIHAQIVTKKRLRFSELCTADDPPERIVVSFLAILELYKRQMVRLEQPVSFGDIDITYIEGSGALFLEDGELDEVG